MSSKRVYEINYDSIEKDGRTTIMIRNIPNKYSLKLLEEEIDHQSKNKYNFLYLPFDFNVLFPLPRITATSATPSSTYCVQPT